MPELKIPLCPNSGRKWSRLPEKLCHAENVDFLFGTKQFFKGMNLPAMVARCLSEYGRHVDILKLANLADDLANCCSINARVLVDSLGNRKFEAVIVNHGDGVVAYPPGPTLTLCVQREGATAQFIRTSLYPLLFSAPRMLGGRVVYAHSYDTIDTPGRCSMPNLGSPGVQSYVGVTKQGWTARWNQHQQAANRGSHYHFHKAIREWQGRVVEAHQVISCGIGLDEAMNLEERLVENFSRYPHGLNMIPGGFAGIKYLAAHGFQTGQRGWENRHLIIQNFAIHCDRAGRPNPLLAMRWRDDAFAASMICANPRNFSLEQVREIRGQAHLGRSAEEISKTLSCTVDRIENVISKKTYSRVS